MIKKRKSECSAAERCASRIAKRREGERGVATVEFALILPLLLILALGTTTLCHAFLTRFLMHSAAYDAARTCALARTNNDSTCVAGILSNKLQKVTMACEGGIKPQVTPKNLQGLEGVTSLEVELKCDFIGGIGRGYLQKHGLKIATITARAAMPY
jgi:hypothetical protein